MGCYYIIQFADNEGGKKIQYTLLGSPNGTAFYSSPVHIKISNKNIWVMWSDYGEEPHGVEYLQKQQGIISITKTNITEKIIVPKYVTSRNDIEFNNYLENIFFKI